MGAFANQNLETIPANAGIGEVFTASPYAVKTFNNYDDGLKVGYFVQDKAGVISSLDGTSTPNIVGVVKRDIAGYLESDTIQKNLPYPKQVVDIVNFGGVSVATIDGATITDGDLVYVVNSGDNAGKATNVATSNIAVNAIFQHAVDGGWKIVIKNYIS
ncbi:MAG: hypothetical protein LBG21_02885 [Campylobacteraceae bacterium]|jgi:hypothetical protein|nr:hypothetical protein [Campylobacteraceae bacterium]